MDENKTGYLTDEELNRLIGHVEQHEMLRARAVLFFPGFPKPEKRKNGNCFCTA